MYSCQIAGVFCLSHHLLCDLDLFYFLTTLPFSCLLCKMLVLIMPPPAATRVRLTAVVVEALSSLLLPLYGDFPPEF